MQSALRFEVQILPGNKIEINLPEAVSLISVGQTVEVIVLLPEHQSNQEHQSISDLLKEIHSQRPVGRSIAEINRDLQVEQDAWGN